MFGHPVRRGLQSSNNPGDIAVTLRTEEELQELATRREDNQEDVADEDAMDDQRHDDPPAEDETFMDISSNSRQEDAPEPDLCSSCEMPVPVHESCICQQFKAVLHWLCGFPSRGRADIGDVLCNLCHSQAEMVRNRKEAHDGQLAAA